MAERIRNYFEKPIYRYKFDGNCIIIDKFVKYMGELSNTIYTENEDKNIQLTDPKGKLARKFDEFDIRTKSMLSYESNASQKFIEKMSEYLENQKEELIGSYNKKLAELNSSLEKLPTAKVISNFDNKVDLRNMSSSFTINGDINFFKSGACINIQNDTSVHSRYKTGEIVEIGDICIVKNENILPDKKEFVQIVAICNEIVTYVNGSGFGKTTTSAYSFLEFVCRKENLI